MLMLSRKCLRLKTLESLLLLNFATHINDITKKSFQMFGFMKRISQPVNDPLSFYTYIIVLLEYYSFIWSPHSPHSPMREKLERVQRKFVKFLSFKNVNFPLIYLMKNVVNISVFLLSKLDAICLIYGL